MCNEWQPIETAPKTTQLILAYNGDIYMLIFWNGGYWYEWGIGEVKGAEPTHWMPLPEPPK